MALGEPLDACPEAGRIRGAEQDESTSSKVGSLGSSEIATQLDIGQYWLNSGDRKAS
jgi:hypothetical protein